VGASAGLRYQIATTGHLANPLQYTFIEKPWGVNPKICHLSQVAGLLFWCKGGLRASDEDGPLQQSRL